LVDSISAGLSAPTTSGLGIAAATLSPAASHEIGQYFKSNDAEGSAAHILAHTVLGAAVAAAGGNDALLGGVSAGGAEKVAPLLSSYLYGKEAKDLTADEKSTISSITGLVASGIGVSTGDVASTVQSGQLAQNAVENNNMDIPFPINQEWGKGAQSLAENLHEKNYSNEELLKALDSYTRGTLPDNADIIKHGGKAWLNLIASAIPVSGGYRVYQGGKWIFFSLSQTKKLNEAAKAAGFNGAISGTISAVSGDDKEGIMANTVAGAGFGSVSSIFKPLQTLKGQVVGGSLTNVGAQSIANIYREYNGKESLELNKSNAVAAGLISGGAKKLEGLGIKSWQPVVIGSSASINAVTSGNNPYKDVNKRIESDKSQKDKTK